AQVTESVSSSNDHWSSAFGFRTTTQKSSKRQPTRSEAGCFSRTGLQEKIAENRDAPSEEDIDDDEGAPFQEEESPATTRQFRDIQQPVRTKTAATSVNGVKIISGKQEARAREFVHTSLKNTEPSLNYRLVETTHPTTKYRMVAVSIQFMATQTLADFSPLEYSRRATSSSFTHKIPTAFIELHDYVTQDDTPRKEVRDS
ncbi:hypothetical protein SARC_06833, partial [Sphaeroforma arctica JP610]